VGATVCLDVNANMSCDTDEPTATTTAGGAFTLAIPNEIDASEHAIVVQVGATTVDEDTGAAVGKPYVLSAPAGESDFISPITTVVHGMLLQNPALTLEDAVTQVKLSIGASSDVSLFEDYVTAKDAANAVADEYERLHRIAQVAAVSLADNHEAIMQAASTQGVDTTDSGAALLALVTNQAIGGLESAADTVDAAGDNFDVDNVTVEIAEVADLAQQVEQAEAVASTARITIQSLLAQGTYWLWASTNDGQQEYEHGFAKAAAEANRVEEAWSFYDADISSWVDGVEDGEYFLTSTGWVLGTDAGSNYNVTYQSDGSAILDMDNTDFALKFSAAELDVSGKPIKDYLGYETHQLVATTIAGDPVFSAGAKIYQVNFIVMTDTYVLPNWFDCDEGTYVDSDGNCNVVWGAVQGRPAYTFAELIYPAGSPPAGNWFSVGDDIEVRLVAGGGVHVTDRANPAAPVVTFTPGAWEYRTVHGEQIIMLTLPENLSPRFWDGGQQILAVRDGHVRRGKFAPANTPETFGEINFNDIAFENIQDNSSIY
jgi:hypothetical protein